MSNDSILNELIAEFKDNISKIDASTQNISNATNRLTIEIQNGQAIIEKYNLEPKKYELILNCTQQMMSICSNFVPPTHLNQSIADINTSTIQSTRDANESGIRLNENDIHLEGTEGNFEEFKACVESHNDQMEKEIRKLNSLKDILNQMDDDLN